VNRRALEAGVYLAPSGAGKSYGAGQGWWIDGDAVIAKAVGWPPGKWWEAPDAHVIHRRNAEVLLNHARRTKRAILFNGDWPDDLPPPVAIVIPGVARISENLRTHHRLRDERTSHYELLIDVMNRNVIGLIQLALRRGVPLITGHAADQFFGPVSR